MKESRYLGGIDLVLNGECRYFGQFLLFWEIFNISGNFLYFGQFSILRTIFGDSGNFRHFRQFPGQLSVFWVIVAASVDCRYFSYIFRDYIAILGGDCNAMIVSYITPSNAPLLLHSWKTYLLQWQYREQKTRNLRGAPYFTFIFQIKRPMI